MALIFFRTMWKPVEKDSLAFGMKSTQPIARRKQMTNPFIPLDDIYAEAARLLKMNLNAAEYEWLKGHVGIVALSAIEYQIVTAQ